MGSPGAEAPRSVWPSPMEQNGASGGLAGRGPGHCWVPAAGLRSCRRELGLRPELGPVIRGGP